jgi:hypothetical protein
MNRTATPVMLVLFLSLTACVSGRPESTVYTSPTTGKSTVIESDREMCQKSCNDDYSRCMDSASSNTAIPGAPAGMFGISAECRKELSECLPSCRSR